MVTQGDEQKIANLLTQYLSLEPEPMLGGNLYLAKWNTQPKSAMRVVPAPVVRASSPRSKMEVTMEINRPDDYYMLSDPFREVLAKDIDARRWSNWRASNQGSFMRHLFWGTAKPVDGKKKEVKKTAEKTESIAKSDTLKTIREPLTGHFPFRFTHFEKAPSNGAAVKSDK